MCGLWGGFSSYLSERESEFVITLGELSFLRGRDSTGVVSVCKKGFGSAAQYNTRTIRAMGDPVNFFSRVQPVKKFLEETKDRCALFGHNRLATIGDKTLENAHPINYESILLCHNGTVPAFSDDTSDKSDSYFIAKSIVEKGFEETIKKINYGAAALVWLDKSKNTLNLFKNPRRPLFVGTIGNNNTWFWASEKWILQVAELQTRLKLKEIHEVPDHQLITFSLSSTTPSTREVKFSQTVYPLAWEADEENVKSNEDTTKVDDNVITLQQISDATKASIVSARKTSVPEVKRGKNFFPVQHWDPKKHPTLKPGVKPSEVNMILEIPRVQQQFWKDKMYLGWANSLMSMEDLHELLDWNECKLCKHQSTPSETIWWVGKYDYLCNTCYQLPVLGKVYGLGHRGEVRSC